MSLKEFICKEDKTNMELKLSIETTFKAPLTQHHWKQTQELYQCPKCKNIEVITKNYPQ